MQDFISGLYNDVMNHNTHKFEGLALLCACERLQQTTESYPLTLKHV